MDNDSSCRLQELSNIQLKISSLFKELLREKNDHKKKLETLNKKLEQYYDEIQNLKNKIETIKKQNETLSLRNDDMRNVISRGIKIFRTLEFSQGNLIREDKLALETLKTIFLEFGTKEENFKITDNVVSDAKEKSEVWQTNKEIQKEFEGLSDLNFCTDFFLNEEHHKNLQKEDVLTKSNSESVLKAMFQNALEKSKSPKESKFNCDNSELMNTIISAKIFRPLQPLQETEDNGNKSPVFKDFGVRKHECLSFEEKSNKSSSPQPVKLINEKFLESSNDIILSPWKRSPRQKEKQSPTTPKRIRRQLNINSPLKSPILKKSNAIEAEISFSGVRKLKQTFLNLNWYKKNGPDELKNSENSDHENFENCDSKDEGDKTNVEEDDFITGSPEKTDQVFEDVKNKKSGQESNNVPFITPPHTSEIDFDETYISSSIVRKCNLKKKYEPEGVIEQEIPSKRPAREKSPEYDSVPFAYKREPVRKKADRMKLPGHACAECTKYYENAFDDIQTQDLRKILNKCSRHRDKKSPELDETPPGYWKPFLTCSSIISPNKNDISKN